MLSHRKETILKNIVEYFIESGEPVGSKSLIEIEQLGLSSATIRNEMSALEELGYIKKPHASAGRIPSQKGYRFYVDNLMQLNRSLPEEENIKKTLSNEIRFDLLCEHVVSQVANKTSCVCCIIIPAETKNIYRFELLCVSLRTLMLVVVCKDKETKTLLLKTDFDVSEDEANTAAAILNKYLANTDLTQNINENVKNEFRIYAPKYMFILQVLKDLLNDNADNKMYMAGQMNLLNYPEFGSIQAMRDYMELLTSKSLLYSVLPFAKRGLKITIGDEANTKEADVSNLSFVSYADDNEIKKIRLSIIGPMRMNYPKTVYFADYFGKVLGDYLKEEINEGETR